MTPAEKQKYLAMSQARDVRPLKDPTNVEVPEKPAPEKRPTNQQLPKGYLPPDPVGKLYL